MEEDNHFREPAMHRFIEKMRKSPEKATDIDKRIWESFLEYVRHGELEEQDKIKDNLSEYIEEESNTKKLKTNEARRISKNGRIQ
jgi:hypothetical protein